MMAPRKVKRVVPEIITVTGIKPEKVEVIEKEKKEFNPPFKMEVITPVPLPDGYVRCLVLIDFKGMEDELYRGDVVDLPERRYKTMSNRGLVKKYNGERQPNKHR